MFLKEDYKFGDYMVIKWNLFLIMISSGVIQQVQMKVVVVNQWQLLIMKIVVVFFVLGVVMVLFVYQKIGKVLIIIYCLFLNG